MTLLDLSEPGLRHGYLALAWVKEEQHPVHFMSGRCERARETHTLLLSARPGRLVGATWQSLQASGAVAVLIALSWRLGPVVAAIVIGMALTAATYSGQTKQVEKTNAAAAADMNGVANQAFQAITTVRCIS